MAVEYDEENIRDGSRQLLQSDCFDFCREKGFTPSQTQLCSSLCLKMFDSIDEDSSLIDLIPLFKSELAALQNKLPQRCLTIISEYINQTLMQHFSLYKFTATEPRKLWKKHVEECVEVLDPPPVFSSGIPQKIWEYNDKIKQIEREEMENDAKRSEEVTELKTDRKMVNAHLKSLSISGDDKCSIRERVRELIQSSVVAQTELTFRMLEHELSAGHEALLHDLEKAVIPRPAPLGSFPLRVVPSRGAARETRDMNSNIASRMSLSQDTSRKSAGKSRGSKR